MQLSCRNITIAYEKETVVDNVSFDIEAGSYVSIVGENGTGKSSILKGLLGLVPLKEGELLFGEGFSRSHIGYLPQQNIMQQEFPASVYEVVLSGCLNGRKFPAFYGRREKALARENLKKMGMDTYAKRSFAELSGGQRQRVLLARALCAADSMLFLDEPVTGLDPVAVREMYGVIGRLNKEFGITIVMVTHDIENALLFSDRILHLGRDDYFYGTKEEYLHSPYAKELEINEYI